MINKERCICILNRKDQDLKMYSLRKMLEVNDMENYFNICLNRLIENECIDEECVFSDLINQDVAFTDDGIFICSEILEGFISKEWLLKQFWDLKEINKNVKDLNIYFEVFRKMKLRDIIKIAISPKTPDETEMGEAFNDLLFYIKLEILSRFFLNKIRIKIFSFFSKIKMKWFARKIQKILQ